MNLLVYVPQMAPFGGMERHVCGLAGALAGRGHRVTVLTTSNSLGPDFRQSLAAHGVALRELPRRRGRARAWLKAAWLLREVRRARAERWDLIYTNGQSGLAMVAWLAGRKGTRVVHHHHTAADAGEQATWSRLFRRVLQRAPELVACSGATREALARALRRDDVRFLPYLTACPLQAAEVRERRYEDAAPLQFGFTGRLVAEKGIDLLCALSTRAEFSGIRWHVHGTGPAYPPEFFRAYPTVTYHGAYAGPAAHAEALQRLDGLVLLSRHNEGMPLSLIEGMSAGLPWLATDRGGTREIAVSPANCVIVEPSEDPARLAAGVRELEGRLRAGRTSRREQRQAYDRVFAPDAVARTWFAFFENRPGAAGGVPSA